MDSWHSYPSIFNLGHKIVANLLVGDVIVEEKIDGSQFSFGVSDGGELMVRSKGAIMQPDAPEPMFKQAVATAHRLASEGKLIPGFTYRAEYLQKPKHNTLAYGRIPAGHLIVFDVNTGHEDYLTYEAKRIHAEALGLECVPLLFSGRVASIEQFKELLDRESVLGGQRIEGVVIKPANYDVYGQDKKTLMGKFVSEAFKEAHSVAWKASNPTNADILLRLGDAYKTEARWNKAVMRLRELGAIEDSPRDIGALMRAVPDDIEKECVDQIKDKLYEWAMPHIRRMSTRGLPDWYKSELLKRQFESGDSPDGDTSRA